MTDAINVSEFNELFGEALNRGGEDLQKVAEVTGLYIQEKVRENSFARQILPPQTVTVAELTRNVNDESLVYIDDVEPDSIAMRVNMRGEPNKTYIESDRYEIRMETISSDRFTKSEQELRSYRMPLTKVIEQNTVKDLQEVVDEKFMEHVRIGLMFATIARKNQLVEEGLVVDSTAATTGQEGAASGSKNFFNAACLGSYLLSRNVDNAAGLLQDGTTPAALQAGNLAAAGNLNLADGFYSNIVFSEETTFSRRVVKEVAKIPAARQLKARTFLLHEFDWVDSIAWTLDDAGLELVKEITIGGYKYTTVAGYTYVTTVRDNNKILEPGQIYAFPAPEMLGRFLVLQNTCFYINKEGRFFHMEAWEECGVGFGNVRGLGLVLLRGAGVNMPNVFFDTTGEPQLTAGSFRLTNTLIGANVIS